MTFYTLYHKGRESYIFKMSSYGGPTAQPRVYTSLASARVARQFLRDTNQIEIRRFVADSFDVVE